MNIKSATRHRQPARNAKPQHSNRVAATRKIVVDFPEPLFQETERAIAELSTSRSALIRLAVERYLAAVQREKLDRELAEGYVANASLDRQVAQEFSAVDYETF